MTKTKAEQWLRAVRELIAYYKGENDDYQYSCSLCKIPHEPGCPDCPWMMFSKIYCTDYTWRYFKEDIVDLRVCRNPRWVRSSLKRLKKWEGRLLDILAEGNK